MMGHQLEKRMEQNNNKARIVYRLCRHYLTLFIHGESHERRTKVPSLETCLASVKSPGNHAFSL